MGSGRSNTGCSWAAPRSMLRLTSPAAAHAPGRDTLMRNTAPKREMTMHLKRKARPSGHAAPACSAP